MAKSKPPRKKRSSPAKRQQSPAPQEIQIDPIELPSSPEEFERLPEEKRHVVLAKLLLETRTSYLPSAETMQGLKEVDPEAPGIILREMVAIGQHQRAIEKQESDAAIQRGRVMPRWAVLVILILCGTGLGFAYFDMSVAATATVGTSLLGLIALFLPNVGRGKK